MVERLRKPRYSQTIPPECRGKISGAYRIDVEKRMATVKTYQTFLGMPGAQRSQWMIGGALLKSFDAWRLLPPEIAEEECEERREILGFIAQRKYSESGEIEYGDLPRPDEITIEISRLVLGTIDYWNTLNITTQFLLEREIIAMISQEQQEFRDYDNRQKKLKPDETEDSHEVKRKNEEDIRQKIIARITERIIELAGLYGDEELGTGPSPEEEKFEEIATETSRTALRAILPPKNREQSEHPTIPAAPHAKRKK